MRLKSFYAKNMTEAMHMVRDTLGEDAIIVATREENGGRSVRVTAAIEEELYEKHINPASGFETGVEQGFELGKDGQAAGADDWLQYDDEENEEAVVEELTEIMLRHSIPEDVTDQILSCATIMGLEQPYIALIASLEKLFTFNPLPAKPSKKAFMTVGPPGSGKTLAVAKLAARATMKGLDACVITTDTMRAGGIEQLQAFTRLLRIDLKRAETPKQLAKYIEEAKDADQILVDTGGYNPFDTSQIKELAKLTVAADIEPLLVMPAALDADESGELARIYATIGARRILPTRLDIARRLGGLLSAAHQGGLVFTDASNTPKVADGLMTLTPKSLASLLMPQKKKSDRKAG